MLNSTKSLAYIAAIIKAVIYGTTVIFTDKLLESMDILDLLALRFLVSGIIFEIMRLTKAAEVRMERKDIGILLITALCEPVLYFVFETAGIKYTSTITTGILLAMAPVFTIVLATLILKEKTNNKEKFFILVRIAGALIITLYAQNAGTDTLHGVILILLAVISGAAFVVMSRKATKKVNSATITYFTNITGMVVFNIINVVRRIENGTIGSYFMPLMNIENIIAIIFLAALSSILATWLNNYALSKLRAPIISALGGVTTITTVTTGVIFAGESIELYHIAGATAILIGIIGMSFAGEKSK